MHFWVKDVALFWPLDAEIMRPKTMNYLVLSSIMLWILQTSMAYICLNYSSINVSLEFSIAKVI